MRILILGPQGSGKGTQAQRIAAEYDAPHVATGDILREAVKELNPEALVAKAKMDRGELVDDATMIAIVRQRLLRPDAANGFVLDGFPRTVAQARALDQIMEERRNGPLVIVDVGVPEAELVRRLASRRICSNCGAGADPFGAARTCKKCGGQLVQRTDDNREVVLERLKIYQQSTRPVLEFYRQRPTFRVVNGSQPPETVATELDSMIDDARGRGANG